MIWIEVTQITNKVFFSLNFYRIVSGKNKRERAAKTLESSLEKLNDLKYISLT